MAAYLLDTSVIIDTLNGKRGRKDLLEELVRAGNTLGCCAINVAEVYAGMRPHEVEATESLLKSLDYYDIEWQIACKAGEIKFENARRGRNLSLSDTLIASVALSHRLTLITDNVKDYPIVGLEIFSLP
ncbi:MAG TPA: PIN domain-containing protein [Candidatus Binataceae bacterium]|nr:PIN domain-containing protein [Candidatus Binataceae bacterium]